MTYDRYDSRGDRSRWSNERFSERDRPGGRDRFGDRSRDEDRGFFERAGDEVASWFGDEDAERRRERDRRIDERSYGRFGRDHDRDRDRGDYWRDRTSSNSDFDRDHGREGGFFGDRGGNRAMGGGTGGESGRPWSSWSSGRDEPSYRPMTGDYSRGEGYYAASRARDEGDFGRSRSMDPHYHSLRRRQMDELDRDYDDYHRENQTRFDEDFTNWRQRRGEKRGLLGTVREHMEVIGSDDEHVGTVDCVAGDRIILTKSDPESEGAHHSLSCSEIDRVEGDRVILDCSAEQARERWRDESRDRALFERNDQGEMGPRMLDRSFGGTYR